MTVGVVGWLVFGVLYHLAGYGMNSYTDWKNGYDKNDPHKQHHPLNTGVMTPHEAKTVVYVLMGASILMAMVMASGTAGIGILAVMLVSGTVYNEWGKELKHVKFLPISIAHSMVFALPYASLGGNLTDPMFLSGLALVFLWVVFQIGISGEVKDLEQDEENLLQDFGAYVIDQGYHFTDISKKLAFGLRMLVASAGILLVHYTGGPSISYLLVGVISAYSVMLTERMLSNGDRTRHQRVQDMSKIEICSMSVLVTGALGFMGWGTTIVILLGSLAWVTGMNRYQWNTWVAPKV